jgi:hypothetical protein
VQVAAAVFYLASGKESLDHTSTPPRQIALAVNPWRSLLAFMKAVVNEGDRDDVDAICDGYADWLRKQ